MSVFGIQKTSSKQNQQFNEILINNAKIQEIMPIAKYTFAGVQRFLNSFSILYISNIFYFLYPIYFIFLIYFLVFFYLFQIT